MGSSFCALHPLHLALNQRGVFAQMIETSELTHYLREILGARTLVVAVSQSGRSIEVVNLLNLARGRCPVIGITNSLDSPLALQSDATLFLQAGPEATVSCKTYVASLLALEWFNALLAGEDLEKTRAILGQAVSAAAVFLRGWESHVAAFRHDLTGTGHLFLAARGSSLSAAETGGLIIKESARFPAEGMSCAAFRHGPFEMVRPDTFVLVFAGDARVSALNRNLVADVKRSDGRAALVDHDAPDPHLRLPYAPDRLRPLLEILPVQMLSLALASLHGREAGKFELASKVTTVE
jgi:glutamine---fructose-6-phosphate transaminase (isomerizing)